MIRTPPGRQWAGRIEGMDAVVEEFPAESNEGPNRFDRELRTQSSCGLHRQVLDAMTNNETWFFRDLHPFTALSEFVIPELISKRKADEKLPP